MPERAQAEVFRERAQVPGQVPPREQVPERAQAEVFRERRAVGVEAAGFAAGVFGERSPKRLTHVCPPSLVFQRAPSVVPAYSTPSSTGDSVSALAVPSSVRVISGEMAFKLSPLNGERNT